MKSARLKVLSEQQVTACGAWPGIGKTSVWQRLGFLEYHLPGILSLTRSHGRDLMNKKIALLMQTCLVVVFMLTGCETTTGVKLADWSGSALQTEKEHRTRFRDEGDSDSFRWLIVNRLRQGMQLGEVNQALGQDGELEPDGSRFMAKDGLSLRDDKVYRWGPDNKGTSIYLVFRDNRLTRFDPKDFDEVNAFEK